MRISSAICRAQQARQLDLSLNDPLKNRRAIAAAAAKAWGLEAIEADKREAGQLAPIDRLDAEITAEFAEEAAATKDIHAA